VRRSERGDTTLIECTSGWMLLTRTVYPGDVYAYEQVFIKVKGNSLRIRSEIARADERCMTATLDRRSREELQRVSSLIKIDSPYDKGRKPRRVRYFLIDKKQGARLVRLARDN